MNMDGILEHYRIEPRTNYEGNKKWLVAYDKKTNDYVRDPDNPRKYLTFGNSDNVLDFFKKDIEKREN